MYDRVLDGRIKEEAFVALLLRHRWCDFNRTKTMIDVSGEQRDHGGGGGGEEVDAG